MNPEITRPYIVFGDDRFERADEQLKKQNDNFSVTDAFHVLNAVSQEGLWATRVSFVYSVKENRVYYVLNNDFKNITEYQFDRKQYQKIYCKAFLQSFGEDTLKITEHAP